MLPDKLIPKLRLQHFRIRIPDAEGNQRADVAENRLPDERRKLVNVLVREGEAKTILARLGQNRREGVRAEILGLVSPRPPAKPEV